MAVVKTTFVGDSAPLSKVQSQIQRDMDKYQRDQERREKEISRIFEREAKLRGQQEQKSLRESEREYNRLVKERERQEKEITRMTLREIREREQAQKEAEADARFRAQNLETFRQSIAARQTGGAQPTGIWNRLSGYQKTQLSFQANDVISGLAMGQSPFQIAAQQGGQIVQIFQQTREAQEGVAKASNASAIAQAAFAANSKQAAVEIAKTQQSATLLGASVTNLGVIGVAGLVTIGAVYKLTQDIEKAAKLRLKTEEEITGELNRQRLAVIEFQKERQKAITDSNFNRFTSTAGSGLLVNARADRERELAKLQQDKDIETQRRGAVLSAIGGFADEKKREAFLTGGLAATQKRIDELREEVKQLDKAIDDRGVDLARGAAGSPSVQFALDNAAAVRAQIEREAIDAFEKRKKQAEEYKKRLEEARQAQTQLFDQALSKSENPFVQFLGRANSEMRQMLELAKNLSPALREAFVANAQRNNRNTLFGMRLDTQIEATGLRNRAAEFRQGFNNDLSDPATVQRLVGQLFGTLGLGSGGTGSVYNRAVSSQFYRINNGQIDWDSASALSRPVNRTPEQQALIDQRLIREAGNYDPSLLNQGQRNTIASAFEREADRKLNAEKAANDFYTEMNKLISKEGLRVSIGQGTQLDIVLDNQSSSNAAIGATSGAVKARYK